MAPSSKPSGSGKPFPGGTYGKYKRATSFFLDWLLRARAGGVGVTNSSASAQRKKPLDVYDKIVAAIAREPTALAPALLQLFPRALEACESAITLREHVAVFFGVAADDAHAHFIARMKDWLASLKRAYVPSLSSAPAATGPSAAKRTQSAKKTKLKTASGDEKDGDAETLDFSNYYDVLDLPDDYFASDGDSFESIALADAKVQPLSAAERARLHEEAFASEVKLELACFFMELEELSEAVYKAFFHVKEGDMTLVEAAAQAKVAIDCAESVIANFLLRYPAILDARDLLTMMQDYEIMDVHVTVPDVLSKWMPFHDPETPVYQYPTSSIMVDTLWVTQCLWKFAPAVAQCRGILSLDVNERGAPYDEETTRDYVVPNIFEKPFFFMQMLPLIYNSLQDDLLDDVRTSASPATKWFLGHFDKFFKTCKVTIHLVFICICWIRSVAAVQGAGGLGRTASLAIMRRRDLIARYDRLLVPGSPLRRDKAVFDAVEASREYLRACEEITPIMRANPLMSGFVLMDNMFSYLKVANDSLWTTSRFRLLLHVYSALHDRELIEEMPFLEEVIEVYEDAIFKNERDAVEHGSFMRSYLVSSNISDAAIDAKLNRRPELPEKFSSRAPDLLTLSNVVSLYPLIANNDLSALGSGFARTRSWKYLMKMLDALTTTEMGISRVLSRDMLRLTKDISEVFYKLLDALDRRTVFEDLARTTYRGLPPQVAKDRALEDVIMMPLLPLLDSLNLDGSTSISEDGFDLLQVQASSQPQAVALGNAISGPLNERILKYCKSAASVIAKKFAKAEDEIEQTYFILPDDPEWLVREFGDAAFRDVKVTTQTTEKFNMLMEMIKSSEGPLRDERLSTFKQHIKEDPGVLACVVPGAATELCSLLHQAAAGRARDLALVEWLIQMGALHNQPKHFYKPEDKPAKRDKQLCNYLAIHSAAKAGLADMVQLFLEVDNSKFLDVVTYHTQESLCHIVVKNDDRTICQMLADRSVDVRHKDASGKHVHDYAKDIGLKRILLDMVRERNEQEASYEEYKKHHPRLRAEADARSKAKQARLRQALEQQRDGGIEAVEKTMPQLKSAIPGIYREAAATALEASAVGRSKKNKKKKKGKKKANAGDNSPQLSSDLALECGSGEDEPSDMPPAVDRMELLTQLFEKLKESNKLPLEERDVVAAQALEIVDTIRSSVQYFATSDSSQGFSRELLQREGNDALRTLHLLSKFHRQLPPEPLVPHIELYNNLNRKPLAPSEPFEKLKVRAGPDVDFAEFIIFADQTATIFVESNRSAQAKEVLELVERRLLKQRQRSEKFRMYVKLLIEGRRHAEIRPLLGSTPEALRQFEWYSGQHGMDDGLAAGALLRLDSFFGYKYFMQLPHVQSMDSPAFERFAEIVQATITEDMPFTIMENAISAGAETREHLDKMHKFILDAAQNSGLRFHTNRCEVGVSSVVVWGFRFSGKEIVRA